MRLGFAVKVLGAGGLPSHDTRRWQSGPTLAVSLDRLEAILGYLDATGIRKVHYSSPRTNAEVQQRRAARRVERRLVLPQLRAHADLVDPIAFEHFLTTTASGLDLDVMLEAKAKDLALLRLREQLRARGLDVEGPGGEGFGGEERGGEERGREARRAAAAGSHCPSPAAAVQAGLVREK